MIVALLIAAQPASAGYAAGALALGAPCPVHAALLAPQAEPAAAHHGHQSPEPATVPFDSADWQAASGFICCAGHVAGVFAAAPVPADVDWSAVTSAGLPFVPAPVDLAGIDPPPRLFL